jgi:hypothetical protein
VKSLLEPKSAASAPSAERPAASNSLTSLFAPPPAPVPVPHPVAAPPPPDQRQLESVWPRALAEAFTPRGVPPPAAYPNSQTVSPPPARPVPSASDMLKLRGEIARLELLVKKLQTELQIERQYNQALELQIHTLTQTE